MSASSVAQTESRSGTFSYADYSRWPDDERWELIGGEAFGMSPAPTRLHQDVAIGMLVQVHAALAGTSCRVYVAPLDVRLPIADEADDSVVDVVQPDLAVVCDPSKLDSRGCRGAPDWIVEVLSPHTAAKDQGPKRALYESRGVREYWLVHPTDRTVAIYRLEDGRYGKPDVYPTEDETTVAILPELAIRWQDVFPEPIEDASSPLY